jgi:Flp pilus assembly protein TadD
MPWSPQPWEALGTAELKAGLLADARKSFRKAVTLDPGDWALWSQLAAVTVGAERTHAQNEVAVLYPRSGLARSGT